MITTFPAERMFGWEKTCFYLVGENDHCNVPISECFCVLFCRFPALVYVLLPTPCLRASGKQPPLLRTRQHAQCSPIPMSYRGLQYKLDMFPEQATIGSLAASLTRYSPVVDPHWLTTFFVHIAFVRESRGHSVCVCVLSCNVCVCACGPFVRSLLWRSLTCSRQSIII